MAELIIILVFISLYGLSFMGEKTGERHFVSAFIIHLGYIAYRAWFLGRPPVTERHDILLAIAASVAGGFFVFQRRMPVPSLLKVLPIFTVILCFFGLFQERMDTIEPNMNTPWFLAYVILFIGGYGLLTLGTAAGVLFLLEREGTYELVQHRMILLGWLLFSFSLVAGSVWFYRVHGVYWLWTAKELWTTVTWFFFSFYLHARLMGSLRGRPAALIGVLGFVVMLFSYLGVTPILGSPWTQF